MSTLYSDTDIRCRLDQAGANEYLWNTGKAFADWLSTDGPIVVVRQGDDSPVLTHAFIEGVLLQGRDVITAGVGGEHELLQAIANNGAASGVLLQVTSTENVFSVSLYNSTSQKVTDQNGLEDLRLSIDAGNFEPAPKKGSISQSPQLS